MKKLVAPMALAVLALAACGSDEGPSAAADDAPAEAPPADTNDTGNDVEVSDTGLSDEAEVVDESAGIEEVVEEVLESDEPLVGESSTPDGICTYVNIETVEQILPGAAGTAWEVTGEPWCDFYGPAGIDGAYLSINEFAADNSEFRLSSQAEELVIDGTPLTLYVDDNGGYELGATIPTGDGMYGGFVMIFRGSDATDGEIRPVLETLASELLANRS